MAPMSSTAVSGGLQHLEMARWLQGWIAHMVGTWEGLGQQGTERNCKSHWKLQCL